jgi:DNA-binding response OmpR family regulator
MHALIIEDDAMIALMIEGVLCDAGFDTFACAQTADAAVASAAHEKPDLITSDVQLIAGNGIDAVAAILAACSTPVVFVTSVAREVTDRMPDASVLPKPFAARQLAEMVDVVMTACATDPAVRPLRVPAIPPAI